MKYVFVACAILVLILAKEMYSDRNKIIIHVDENGHIKKVVNKTDYQIEIGGLKMWNTNGK